MHPQISFPYLCLSRSWKVLISTSIGIFMVSLDSGLINIALPEIKEFFNADFLVCQWVSSAYLFSICIFLPICGKLGDLFTRRKIYLTGFFIFLIGSIICSCANEISYLIIGRLLQGVGSAMIIGNNQAIIVTNYPTISGRALGINAAIVALGTFLSPIVGGYILSLFCWRSLFYLHIAICISGLFFGYKALPHEKAKIEKKLDINGTIFLAGAIACPLIFLNYYPELSYVHNFLLIAGSIIFTIYFFRWENKIKFPIVDIALLKEKTFFTGNILNFLVHFAIFSNNTCVPLYLSTQGDFSIKEIGLILSISSFITIIFSPCSGHLSDIYKNVKRQIFTGALFVIIGLVIEISFIQSNLLYMMVMGQIFIGLGYSIFQAPNNNYMMKNISEDKLGISNSFIALVRNFGKMLGVIVSAEILILVSTRISFLEYYSVNSEKINLLYGFKASIFIAALLLGGGTLSLYGGGLPILRRFSRRTIIEKL